MAEVSRGRPQHGVKLVQKHGKPSWYVQYLEDGKTKRASTGTADRQAAELFLKDWVGKREAAKREPLKDVDKIVGFEREPRVLPARLPPGVTKARKNQEVGRDAEGHRLGVKLPDRLRVPDLETAKKRFSARMRDARIAAGLSQADVAYLLFGSDPDGTYRKRYINWEIGRSFMTQNVIPVFARLVKVDCNFLFENEDLAEYLDGGAYGEKR